ncbi:MAG: putative selenate reductase subunit YgfK [Eubacteriales bacterium]|nr:putative selenate reductase subunit YgfK [Eubacteriales bacterium]
MSDKMTPIPFGNLMTWVLDEHKKGQLFGIHYPYIADKDNTYEIFGKKLETAIGPAAGPHSQLAQNIVASYYAGARFFELKTVQKLDGEDLPVSKPCILANDECYNCEWSTELYVPQAFDEYLKAWFMIKVLSKEWGLGDPDGFQFNMSVGYDLDGIKTEKVDKFIEGMKDAKGTPIFNECKNWLLEHLDVFEKVTREDIEAIDSKICDSVTLSTLHGCPPQEIERIANYLIEEKGLNTFIKCNPTLLGYEYARKTLDEMGYDYIAFTDFHFKDDLQYEDAVPMLGRLMEKATAKGVEFGVKITNTFPVDVTRNELPSTEMYMSGKSLYPLSLAVAAKLSTDFDGRLRIAYSGGCDYFNIKDVIDAGIWPVTMATTLLKPGGYQRFKQIAELFDGKKPAFSGVDVKRINELKEEAKSNKYHVKPIKPLPSRKNNKKVPLVDCFIAPCMETCPIHQDLTTYIRLRAEGKDKEALESIITKNPLPFITGTICNHACMDKCTRNFYEQPVDIRGEKLKAARGGYDEVIKELKRDKKIDKKVVVIGAGPAGLASAYFLGRAGADVVVYDKEQRAGGVVANIIPDFRLDQDEIEKDIAICKSMGAEFKLGQKVDDIKAVMEAEHADACVLCIGAHKNVALKIEGGEALNALHFLHEFKDTKGNVELGENVVIVGAGNTAMDTARAAKKNKGVKNVYLVYRRDKRNMPADEEELEMAIEDGVIFKELLSPVELRDGKLVCQKMELGAYDERGRQSVVKADGFEEVPCDVVIASIGEQVDGDFYKANGIEVTDRGFAKFNPETGETSIPSVYVAGDGKGGAAVVVKAIADAMKCAEAIVGEKLFENIPSVSTEEKAYTKKSGLIEKETVDTEAKRCVSCDYICENCVSVCPNRANISIKVPGHSMHQIIHVDYMCNECGNCESFCPYASAPYKDKFTLFASKEDMENSTNDGFYYLDKESGKAVMRLAGTVSDYEVGKPSKLYKGLTDIIDAVFNDYHYLIF